MRKHGYDDRKGSTTQLKNLLNLPEQQFEEIKRVIKSHTLTTLDIDFQGRSQPGNLLAVDEKLKTLYPGIFDTEKKVAFGRQLSLQFHRQARRVRARRTRRASASQQRDSISVANLLRDSVRASRSIRGSRSKQEPESGPHTPLDPVAVNPVHVGSPPQHLGGEETNTDKSSTALPSCRKMQVVACKPAAATSASTSTANSSRPSGSTRPGVSYIHSFLQGCSPPLEHFLSRFVDLGFQSPAMLREVASKWTPDERRDLLKRIAPGPNGKGLTELEMMTLERGFRSASII